MRQEFSSITARDRPERSGQISEVVVPNILRRARVENKVGYGSSTIYKMMAEGTFPESVPLGPKAVGWVESEIDDWIKARIAVRDAKSAGHDAKSQVPKKTSRPRARRSTTRIEPTISIEPEIDDST